MKRYLLFLLVLLILLSGLTVTTTHVIHAASTSKCVNPSGTNTLHGTLQGANYTIEVPADWHGTLVLYSHGYVFADQPPLNPAPDAPDALTASALLQQGYALAGSSYSQNGWALQQAFHDQIALLDFFDQTCGTPTRAIAWGQSLGGIITAGLVQLYPDRFTAALPMCGVLAGGIATWNQALDGALAFNVLLARNALPLVHITNPTTALLQASTILDAAQLTSQGRARIALAAALTDLPGWFDPASPEPAQSDFTAQENNQYLSMSLIDFAFVFKGRAELEGRAGGNFSWNTNVDYNQQLGNSVDRDEVAALYKQAGLDLNNDLHTLATTQRIKADPAAEAYLNKYITFNGNLNIPVLTAHTTGDNLVVNQDEQAYASVVSYQGNSALLRQIFVHRAGHCTFTPAETLTAFQTLLSRLDHNTWGNSTDPALLN